MNKNKSLYQLIQSMSGNEKRFFKIQSSRHTIGNQNNYVLLFNLFDNQTTFDNNAIELLAKKSHFVKNFPAEKNYLYNLILDCLDSYHKESNIDRSISKLINIGRILMEKKLDEQGVKVLEKARKISLEQNRYENLIPINQLLIRKSFDKETLTEDYLKELHSESKFAIKRLERKLYYQQALDKLMLTRRIFGKNSEKEVVNNLEQLFPHLSEPIPKTFESWDSGVYYLLSRLEYCRISRNREQGRILALKMIDLMERYRHRITGEYIDRYTYCLYNFIIMHAYNNEEEKNEALNKLRHLDQFIDVKVTKREHARTFEFHYTTLSDLHLRAKEYSKIKETLPEFERAEAIYKDHITPSFNIAMHFNIAALFFGMGEYREALKWGNKVSNAAIPFRKDIYHYLRTLNLIIHLELNNTETLQSIIGSITYYNKKYQVNSLLQTTLIKHCNALLKAHSRKKRNELYHILKETLITLKDMPTENSIFEDIDLIAWVEAKCKSS